MKKIIFIVDDTSTNRELLALFLKNENHELVFLKDGNDVVREVVSGGKVNLIIMDLQLPGINGREACKIIRRYHETKGIRIPIIETTATIPHEPDPSIFDGVLEFPHTKENLLNVIKTNLF